jgi:pimeloyl-ACP methyl ester carboxylesterase
VAPLIVLLHSPIVGPMTWRRVETLLVAAGHRVAVPDLTAAVTGPPPYQPAIVSAVAAAVADARTSLILAGHSGAGPLLPGIATALPDRVDALLYVDSVLPYPGRSWMDTAPTALAEHLTSLEHDGLLPPWDRWFPPKAIERILPDPATRAAFVGELPRLPLAYFTEATPAETWTGSAGYLLLSEAYRDDATAARSAGLPVVELVGHHLAMLTAPDRVAAALSSLLG